MKPISFWTVTETVNQMKKSTEWETIFANNLPDTWLIPNIYKKLLILNT